MERMSSVFHKRFDIKVDLKEAHRRFVNRAQNLIFSGLLFQFKEFEEIRMEIASTLGEEHVYQKDVQDYTQKDFIRTLQAIEAFWRALRSNHWDTAELEAIVNRLIMESEVNLSIYWKEGEFFREGAPILDQKLVNDVLGWLESSHFDSVVGPFQKGLKHLLNSDRRPELRPDVITDMYEALEALAGAVTNRPEKDLSANRELFLSKVGASESYKQLLKDYIEYANDFRHAATAESPRPKITLKEAESFVYLTGLFIRLAIPTK